MRKYEVGAEGVSGSVQSILPWKVAKTLLARSSLGREGNLELSFACSDWLLSFSFLTFNRVLKRKMEGSQKKHLLSLPQ